MLATFAGCNVPPAVTNFPTAKLTLFPLTAKPSPEISGEFPEIRSQLQSTEQSEQSSESKEMQNERESWENRKE